MKAFSKQPVYIYYFYVLLTLIKNALIILTNAKTYFSDCFHFRYDALYRQNKRNSLKNTNENMILTI